MRYNEIVSYPRHWNSDKYPVVAHILIEAEHLSPFERLAEDQTQIAVLGHDLADGGQVVVHVACASEAVQRRLESRWA